MQTFIWVNQQMWLPDKTEMSAETYSNKSMTYLKGRWDENGLFLYFWVRTVIRGQKCSEGPKICSHLYMNKACVVARYAWEGIIHLETDLKWTSEYLRCNKCSIASTVRRHQRTRINTSMSPWDNNIGCFYSVFFSLAVTGEILKYSQWIQLRVCGLHSGGQREKVIYCSCRAQFTARGEPRQSLHRSPPGRSTHPPSLVQYTSTSSG